MVTFLLIFYAKSQLYDFFGKIYWQYYCEDRIVCWQQKTNGFLKCLIAIPLVFINKNTIVVINTIAKRNDWTQLLILSFWRRRLCDFFIFTSYSLAASDCKAYISRYIAPKPHKPQLCARTLYRCTIVVYINVVTCAANGISHLINC